MSRIFRLLWMVIPLTALLSCEDDEGVGSSIQPSEDVLSTYSNKVDVVTNSVLTDSVLSRYDYFILGRFRDAKFGEVAAEFMTQLDGRVDGLYVPDTTVVSYNSATSGILKTLLTDIDASYGDIKSITSPSNVVVDSTRFYIQYSDQIFGDTTAMQAISVYELSSPMEDKKYYTNASVSDFCDKKKFLGQKNYQLQNKRVINIPLDNEVGERILSAYQSGSEIKTQEQFNKLFPGVYVSHTFNQGTFMQILVAGVQIFYHYDADITTTYDGKSVVAKGSQVKNKDGKYINPLVASVFLSANKTVNRVNVIQKDDLTDLVGSLNKEDYTYTFSPSGLYTAIHVPYETLMDSVKRYAPDTTKVMLNMVKLTLYRHELNWNTKLKASSYLLLMSKSKVADFFYKNQLPDGLTSFVAAADTAKNCYSFYITASVQNKLRNHGSYYDDDLVLVPAIRVAENGVVYYRQQLWMSSTMFYGATAEADSLRPRLDVVYTRRE